MAKNPITFRVGSDPGPTGGFYAALFLDGYDIGRVDHVTDSDGTTFEYELYEEEYEDVHNTRLFDVVTEAQLEEILEQAYYNLEVCKPAHDRAVNGLNI